MNKKLILLGVIVLIIILLGCMFITNEGFQTCATLSADDTSTCKHTCLGLIRGECDTEDECNWDKTNNKCISNCSSLKSENVCNNNSACKWEDTKCINKDDEDCNKIKVTNNNGSTEELQINNVCPKDPKCVEICIRDHTWIKKHIDRQPEDPLRAFNNTNQLNHEDATLKDPESKHLVTASQCMECIKNFYPIISLIHKHECSDKILPSKALNL